MAENLVGRIVGPFCISVEGLDSVGELLRGCDSTCSSNRHAIPITSPSLVCINTVSASGAGALGLVASRSSPLSEAHSLTASYKHLYLAEVEASVSGSTARGQWGVYALVRVWLTYRSPKVSLTMPPRSWRVSLRTWLTQWPSCTGGDLPGCTSLR
eukprot:scaffold7848_cov484-Prasinococcus_capsulatus_cf.AAC.2